jgi:hypothetical protein
MNRIARLFTYTTELEKALNANDLTFTQLHEQLYETRARVAGESYLKATIRDLQTEVKSLRQQNLDLLDRVALKLQMVPVSEPLKSEPLTEDQTAERSKRIDSVRRTGPVASTRQAAEAAYFAERQRQEEMRSIGNKSATG